MFLRAFRKFPFATLLGAALAASALLGSADAAGAAIVTNGGFETRTLEGWTTSDQTGEVDWTAYDRQDAEEDPPFFPPPVGESAAYGRVEGEHPDSIYLYQDVALPPAATDRLSMYLAYFSPVPFSLPAEPLYTDEAGLAPQNRQIRVDVLKPNAPTESISPNDVLATVYQSKPGDPLELPPTALGADLSAFAGQTVRLRIAAAVEGPEMRVGVDEVSIDSTPIPPPPPPPAAVVQTLPPPSNEFVEGTLIRNKRTGGAMLVVSVPGPGTVIVSDARRKVAIATRRSVAAPPPILIRSTSVEAGAAGAVRMPIRPTAAATKRLRRNGKLRFRLQVTFAPTGGLTAIQGFAGTLVRKLNPARR